MKKFIIAIALFTGLSVYSQVDYSEYVTSGEPTSYNKVAVKERPVIAYPHLREADNKYYKRIIRCIDSRQKMNKHIEWPRSSLNYILHQKATSGEITAYTNDSLKAFYTPEDIAKKGGTEYVDFVNTDPTDATVGYDTVVIIPFEYYNIRKFWLMEDWIFDYKHSVFKPRIIAIAPIFTPMANMDYPWAWMRMDDLRPILAQSEMFNRANDAARLSFDDFFQMRLFDSYIVKESNMYDIDINKFEEFKDNGVAALLESDRIKNDLFIFEHDLWQY